MILDWTSGFKRRHLSDTDDARGSDLLFLGAMILIMSHAILRELSLLRLIWVTQSRDQPANWWLFYDCRATHDIETHSVHFKSNWVTIRLFIERAVLTIQNGAGLVRVTVLGTLMPWLYLAHLCYSKSKK